MNHRTILESICNEWSATITREPYQITAGGRVYEFANDGFQLLAFPVEQSDLPELPADVPKVETVRQRIAAWLTAPATHTTSAAAFANFLNLAECAKCPCCKGSGKRKPEMRLVSEYGLNDEFDSPRYVKIGGYPFDANRIARTLALLDLNHLAGEVAVVIRTQVFRFDSDLQISVALIFHGGKWTFMIMGLSIERTKDADFDGEWELDAIE